MVLTVGSGATKPTTAGVALVWTLVLFIASLAVRDADRGPKGATITTFRDALWWGLTTVTTVG